MRENFTNTALIIIDVQKAFEDEKWGPRNNLHAEDNIKLLLKTWRKREYPIIHIQHLSDNVQSIFHPSKQSSAFKDSVVPVKDETIFKKKVNSAFIGTGLEEHLKENNIRKVVIVGLTTPHCVSTTTRMSGNLGFETYLVSDATAAFAIKGADNTYYSAEQIHAVSLATLDNEFAKVLTTEEVIQKLSSIETTQS
ncbi:cysteine hydrolase family protein [Priestia filamentosa]|uniref:Isochorismatase n=1 Tax=Priestia filamentosa TaxID=1402861 RepID=A0A1X7G2D2_9BACI|nr:cysteine hydrolase family protein [Priestia filamentosa]AKO92110.1 isochorismatase [Priestia filamentosa]MDT3762118.1 cysteine hydrolase family protein [Priestia filamentosa]OXS65901.1 cysteine hydrolase [Priestia filamentosa]RJS64604.1 cysteine hydrolase [Priestia filamentosa]WCM17202.1 cysteine hydrolase family protein [Priestia filamentosa]